MKVFKTPLQNSLSLMLIGCSVGLLSACSSSDKEAETLAQTSGTFISTPKTAAAFDNHESRNNGAWGAVYVTERELNDTNRNIVNSDHIPNYDEDPSLDKWKEKFGNEHAFTTNDGAKLYHDSCAGCHMHQGEGAFSAGYYPPLADNPKMKSKYYVIDILINGFRGMPSFRDMLNDEQMAAVTQYLMQDLNGYSATVTAEDVAQLRPALPPQADRYD